MPSVKVKTVGVLARLELAMLLEPHYECCSKINPTILKIMLDN